MKSHLFRQSWYVAIILIISLNNTPIKAKELKQEIATTNQAVTRAKKPWTFLAYIAANNNLHSFALQNLREMTYVGSNDNINIVVQFDGIGERNIKRYLIERGNARLISDLSPDVNTISGTPQSLYQFIKWGYQNFPADHIALDLWNHGSGIKDPSIWGRFFMRHRDDFFTLNPGTNKLELNRRISDESLESDENLSDDTKALFQNFAQAFMKHRGIAFNDSEEVYIDNQQLKIVLENANNYVLIGKKIDIVFMDACHMGMVELASKLRPFVNYMVASSEVEPGRGYNYERLFAPFNSGALSPKAFAVHGVQAYEQEYKSTQSDYTQSAVDLSSFGAVEEAVFNLGKSLLEGISLPDSQRAFDLVKLTRLSSKYSTEFYDTDYIDAGHLFASLISKSREILTTHAYTLNSTQKSNLETINRYSSLAYGALTESIIAETHGSSLSMSHGLGIFFPKRNIHSSYMKCTFDRKTGWSIFLNRFLNKLKYGREQ